MVAKTVHTWKAGTEDISNLKALKDANIENNESDRIRAGLKLLVKKYKLSITEKTVKNE